MRPKTETTGPFSAVCDAEKRRQDMLWELFEQQMHLGQMLVALRRQTPPLEFEARLREIGIDQKMSLRLMRLALHHRTFRANEPR